MTADKLLTAEDVAERLRCSPGHAAKLLANGTIGATRIGRLVRCTEESLAEFIASRTAPPRRSRRGAAA